MAEIEQIHGDEADGTAIDVGRVKAFLKRAHQALARQASARSCFTAAARRGRWERWRFAKSRTLLKLPPRAVAARPILLTDLLTADLDDLGRRWTRQPPAGPPSRPD